MILILVTAISYIIGSIPVGLVIGQLFYKVDIRKFGSGNIGASNFYRTIKEIRPSHAVSVGLAAFTLDLLKGLLPVLAARHWYPSLPWAPIIAGAAAILGHNSSIFLKFTGGKGVATSCGVTIALSWKATMVGLVAFLAVTFSSGFISLGSIVSAPITGFLIWKFNHYSAPYGVFGLLVAASVIYKHRSNISRLRAGTELSIRKKKPETRDNANAA